VSHRKLTFQASTTKGEFVPIAEVSALYNRQSQPAKFTLARHRTPGTQVQASLGPEY